MPFGSCSVFGLGNSFIFSVYLCKIKTCFTSGARYQIFGTVTIRVGVEKLTMPELVLPDTTIWRYGKALSKNFSAEPITSRLY